MNILHFLRDLFVSRSDSKDERNANLVKNQRAIKEDRWSALKYFEDHPDSKASVSALLPRFDYSLQHGILDTREKELAMKGLVRFGDKISGDLKGRLKETTHIAWPLKILKAFGNDSFIVETLLDMVNYDDTTFDESRRDKNYDIFCYLVDYKLTNDQWKPLVHFLKDLDERVRFAVVELLIEQDFSYTSEVIEPFLLDVHPDNSRIRQTVLRAYIEKQWEIKNISPSTQIIGPVFVSSKKTLEVRE